MASSSSSSSERPIDDALMRSKVIEFKTKLKALAKFDVWLALSIARSDENKIPSLLVPLGYDLQEFEAIVLFGKIWPGYGRDTQQKKKAKKAKKTKEEKRCEKTNETLQKKFNDVLTKHGIATQEYWNNHMVGRACRAFLDQRESILKAMRKCIIDGGYGREEADDFFKRHMEVLTPLSIAARHMRRVAVLSSDETAELKLACAEYGSAFRRNFPDSLLTPKQSTLELVVPLQIDMFSSLGIFSEENVESLHTLYTEVMDIVKVVRNPTKRHEAGLVHFNLRRASAPLPEPKIGSRRKRNSDGCIS